MTSLIGSFQSYCIRGALVWHFALAFALFGLPQNLFATACEEALTGQLLARTRFVNLEFLDTQTDAQLMKSRNNYKDLLGKLEAEKTAASAKSAEILTHLPAGYKQATAADQIRMEKKIGLYEARAAVENLANDVKSVSRYIQAIERAIERRKVKRKFETPLKPVVIEVKVEGRTYREVMTEVAESLEKLEVPVDRQVLRFFPSAREDLVLQHGTDRFFGTLLAKSTAWDEYSQEQILKERGLSPEDGLFADLYEAVMDFRLGDAQYLGEFESDFMRGSRSLSVYDLNQLEDLESDFFIFKRPAQKGKALLALIRPKR